MTTEGMASSGSGGPARKRSPLFTVFFLVVALLIVVGGVSVVPAACAIPGACE